LTKVKSLTVGDPAAPETVIGPLINERQSSRLAAVVDRAVDEGAHALVRGDVDGTLFGPTVLADARPDMEISRVEMFGPVVLIMEFETDDDAVRLANDSDYGLSGAVHTSDIDRG